MKNINIPSKTIDINGEKITVYQYIPARDILDLVNSVLQKSKADGYYNPFAIDVFTHLGLVYLATDLVFDNEDRADELALYDSLETNGILQKVIDNFPKDIYQYILEIVDNTVTKIEDYNKTAAAVLSALANQLPQNAEAAMNFVNSFEPDKYEAVKKFAEAANGGRDIKTNKPVKVIKK